MIPTLPTLPTLPITLGLNLFLLNSSITVEDNSLDISNMQVLGVDAVGLDIKNSFDTKSVISLSITGMSSIINSLLVSFEISYKDKIPFFEIGCVTIICD